MRVRTMEPVARHGIHPSNFPAKSPANSALLAADGFPLAGTWPGDDSPVEMRLSRICGCLLLAILSLPLINSGVAQTNAPEANPAPAFPLPSEGIVVLHDVIIGKGGGRDLHAEWLIRERRWGLSPRSFMSMAAAG